MPSEDLLDCAIRFLIGPDRGGLWIVCDVEGVCGAVFVTREEALHYAKAECEAQRPVVAEFRFVDALDWRTMFAKPAMAGKRSQRSSCDGQYGVRAA